jgi:hypothetical protein
VPEFSTQGPQGGGGDPGPPAVEQTIHPLPGANGLLNGKTADTTPPAPCHSLTDIDFADQCSAQHLWSILTTAERDYLNESFAEAIPRLNWVSTMARLLSQA